MTVSLGTKDAHDQMLVELIDEITKRLQAGERVDPEAYIAEHADLAGPLRELLPALEFLADLPKLAVQSAPAAQPLVDPPTATDASGPLPGMLGDFRILREVGRGGMGVVYEAQQVSLSRRVALKVLPFAAVLDQRRLQRFKNEAQAAAALDHPNIVSVHSVGCERAVHFYAMQYVEGQTLAQVINQLSESRGDGEGGTGRRGDKPTSPTPTDLPLHPVTSSPAHAAETQRQPQAAISTEGSTRSPEFFRTVANLGMQAAEALEHAHSMGVVHRDVKPSNLMVDDRGHLWITDFGLAMTQTDANLTMTGDLLGTLRYMSPEQVQAKHGVLDHRTDVYSLGITLYELLTLQPAFGSNDRQELLRQIPKEEPRPPRQLNETIPKDLETIVLKAIEKEAAARYVTAEELADDLRRFIEDRPIQARRPSLLGRTTRWARRHRPVVWSAMAATAVAVVALAVSILLVARAYDGEKEQRQRAQRTATEAKAQRNRADTQRAEAVRQRNRADSERAGAVRQRNLANENLYLARMRLAQQDWETGQIDRLYQMLDAEIPEPGQADLRGWEWYYYLAQCHRDVLLLTGHSGSVSSVSWSPDGKRLASGSWDGTVRIWDATTGTEVRTIRGLAGGVRSVAWSPDGRQLASGDDAFTGNAGGRLILWDPDTGRKVRELEGAYPKRLAWNPGSDRIATYAGGSSGPIGHEQKTVKIWDVTTGKVAVVIDGHTGSIRGHAWSPDGKRLASAENETLRIWDSATGKQALAVPLQRKPGRLGWSPDGQHLAAGTGEVITIWDATTGKEVLHFGAGAGRIADVAWSPDGKRLAAPHRMDNTIRVWDPATGEEIIALRGHASGIGALAWSPDGRRIASGGGDSAIRIWDLSGRGGFADERFTHATSPIAWSPSGKYLASAGDRQGEVKVWEAATGQEIHTFSGHQRKVLSLGWSPDAEHLVSGGADRRAIVWSLESGKETHTLHGHTNDVVSVAWSPVGKHVASAGKCKSYAHTGDVKIWDATTGEEVLSLRHEPVLGTFFDDEDGQWLAWSPDGRQLALATRRTVAVFDVAAGRKERILAVRQPEPSDSFSAIAWSPDGRHLAASLQSIVCIWDSTAQFDAPLLLRGGGASSLAFSPDSKRLALGGESVRIWDAATGQQIASLRGGADQSSSVVWSPDGRRLAAAGAGSGVTIWDASHGYQLADSPAFRQDVLRRRATGGPHEQGIEALRDLADEFPNVRHYRDELARLYADRGITLFRAEDIDGAIRDLTEAIRIDPEDPHTYIFRGIVYGAKREFEEALADFSKALELRPNGGFYHCRANTHWKMGQFDNALADWTKAIELAPQIHKSYGHRGAAYYNLGDYDRAIADFNEAIRLQPDAAFYSNRAIVYREKGDLDRAIADHNEAVRLDPKGGVYWGELGLTQFRAGNWNAALETLQEAVRLDPKLDGYWGVLGATQYRSGNWHAALEALQKVTELDPDRVSIFLAMTQWQLGQKEEARKSYKKAVEWIQKNQPDNERLRRFRSEAAELLGISEGPQTENGPQPSAEKETPEDNATSSESQLRNP